MTREAASPGGPLVLVVDDDRSGREMLAEFLRFTGMRTAEAGDGAEALETARRVRPDAVLIDLTIPVLNGAEVIRRLRADPELRDAALLVLTGHTAEERLRAAREAGCDAILTKPCAPDTVLREIRHALVARGRLLPGTGAERTPTPLGPEAGRRPDAGGGPGAGGGPEAAADRPDSATEAGAPAKTVLVVEDFEDAREMYAEYLQFKGYRVVTAANGQDAVDKAKSESPDLILMDLSLPVMDGLQATREIKGDQSTRNIPVVALTGHVTRSVNDGATDAGCDDFLPKPCLPEEVEAKIRKMLSAGSTRMPVPTKKGSE